MVDDVYQCTLPHPERLPTGQAWQRWPLAGAKLTDTLREILGITPGLTPERIAIPALKHGYSIQNGYLVPFYDRTTEAPDHPSLDRRNEELIIDRVRSFFINAQPGLMVKHTQPQIARTMATFKAMPETTQAECSTKAAFFPLLVGMLVMRFEALGRVIFERDDSIMQDAQPSTQHLLSDAELTRYRQEYHDYYSFLMSPEILPLLHVLQLADRAIDRDGLLIDLIREMGKPLNIDQDRQERFVRNSILSKMGDAAESIDELRDLALHIIQSEPAASHLFGPRKTHNVTPTELAHDINEFGALCRARCCIKRDDPDYADMSAGRERLLSLFTNPGSIFQSPLAPSFDARHTLPDTMRLLRDLFLLMNRTANTRIPCNHKAPQPWIPNLSADASPMAHYLATNHLAAKQRSYAEAITAKAAALSKNEAHHLLNQSFCSTGVLRGEFEHLQAQSSTSNARSA